jgi:S-adenosylmethionine hydrolase
MMTHITLTTDFGTADGYVGAMKGVILSLAPDVSLVDISHAIPRHDLRHGALVLARAAPLFPTGTIHVAVIDPGVGGARRGIALQTPAATFVGPDNGLFTPFLRTRTACIALTNRDAQRRIVSSTFHGRDIFAPVAAHLANGFPLAELGPPVDDPVSLPHPRPQWLPDGRLQAEVVYVDHFGNLVTNLGPLTEPDGTIDLESMRVFIGDVSLAVCRTYADAAHGALLALVGSNGYLEIAVREGSAAERLGMGVGAKVKLQGISHALEDLAVGTAASDHG